MIEIKCCVENVLEKRTDCPYRKMISESAPYWSFCVFFFLLLVGRPRPLLVVSYSFWVFSDRFLLVVVRFWWFQVVPRFNKYNPFECLIFPNLDYFREHVSTKFVISR